MDALNIKRATIYPKATEHIDNMIQMIATLIDKGIAYQAGGDVLFDISKKEDYGKLSKKVLEELDAGNRVKVDDHKLNKLDFVLWKQSKPGEPSWDSPWGSGRPGWHIECSAMAAAHLGKTIDIHAGGEDLMFPHHENEIAQSECCHGVKFSNIWLHSGFLTIKDSKMSKSLKNFSQLEIV